MNQEHFKRDVHSSLNTIFIEYMTAVEAYYIEVENEPYSKEIEDNIKEYRHTYNANIQKRLRDYLGDINGSPLTDEQKEEARQTLYSRESAFHAEGVKLELIILNRFKEVKQ